MEGDVRLAMRKGVLYALSSYILWGFLPIYMKWLADAVPLEILSHRVIWSLVLLATALTMGRNWGWLVDVLRNPRVLLTFALTALLLSINWLTYIWSVVNNHIVDGTLGYFMNPLVNVLLGVIFLRERLRHGQLLAIGVAAMGVGYMAMNAGVLPWVGLTLAFSFSGYALLRKVAPLNSLHGLTLETLLLSIPGLGYLVYLEASGGGGFIHHGWQISLLLLGAGAITAAPLLLFAAGARRIPLSTLGILQYTSPTIQFLIAVYLFGEAFTPVRVVGFGLIWTSLLIYVLEGLFEQQRRMTLRYAH
jgi:chloramphenicol-sensitive protein RarD